MSLPKSNRSTGHWKIHHLYIYILDICKWYLYRCLSNQNLRFHHFWGVKPCRLSHVSVTATTRRLLNVWGHSLLVFRVLIKVVLTTPFFSGGKPRWMARTGWNPWETLNWKWDACGMLWLTKHVQIVQWLWQFPQVAWLNPLKWLIAICSG